MSKLHLGGALALIGVVLGSQLRHHDHEEMVGHEHNAMSTSSSGMAEVGHATVHLAVTGMT